MRLLVMLKKEYNGDDNEREKLPSEVPWYASTCVTPGVTARGHSISINQKQSAPISINQRRCAESALLSADVIVNQTENLCIMALMLDTIYIYWHKCSISKVSV